VLRDFACFALAVWAEWKILLTGGTIMAGLALWNSSVGRSLSPSVSLPVVGVTLVLAAFFAWRKEWIRGGRGFIVVDPKSLVKLFDGRTDVYARTLIRPYVGRWTKITGEIRDIRTGPFVSLVRLLINDTPVDLELSRWKLGPFVPLPSGTLVTVAGRISSISSISVSLRNCELMEVDDHPR
jgi:hypothetical protein